MLVRNTSVGVFFSVYRQETCSGGKKEGGIFYGGAVSKSRVEIINKEEEKFSLLRYVDWFLYLKSRKDVKLINPSFWRRYLNLDQSSYRIPCLSPGAYK